MADGGRHRTTPAKRAGVSSPTALRGVAPESSSLAKACVSLPNFEIMVSWKYLRLFTGSLRERIESRRVDDRRDCRRGSDGRAASRSLKQAFCDWCQLSLRRRQGAGQALRRRGGTSRVAPGDRPRSAGPPEGLGRPRQTGCPRRPARHWDRGRRPDQTTGLPR